MKIKSHIFYVIIENCKKNYINLAREKNIKWTKKQFPETITKFLGFDDDRYITIIDEAHTLFFRPVKYGKNYYGKNQLVDIAQKSLITIAVYDPKQVVQYNSWINPSEIIKFDNQNIKSCSFNLETQMRMRSSNLINQWIEELIYNKQFGDIPEDDAFEFKIFNDANLMYTKIKEKNKINNKSRMVATYDYQWKPDGNKWYVQEGELKLPWNRHYSDDKETWTELDDTINEIGSVYSVQGFDLEYVGVIIGPSVTLDAKNKKIIYNVDKWQDNTAKKIGHINNSSHNIPQNIQEKLIQNALNVLMSRGVKGLYIYFSDVKY